MNMRRNLYNNQKDSEGKETSVTPMTLNTNKKFDTRIDPENNSYTIPQENSKGCFKKIFPHFKIFSFSFLFLFLNIFIYVLEILINNEYYHNMNCTLFRMGAKYSPAIRHDFEIYRLFTPIFLHANIPHLISNSLSILLLGFYIENLIGKKAYMMLYMISGIISQLASSVLNSYNISVGASGSIMGISSFFIFYYYLNYRDLSEISKRYFYYFIGITLMNLLQPITSKGDSVDIFSHLGGFTSGMMFSILIVRYEMVKYDDQVNLVKKLKYVSSIALMSIIGVGVFFLFWVVPIQSNLLKRVCSNLIHYKSI
jgi:membrane associated rhomboid family serine protease